MNDTSVNSEPATPRPHRARNQACAILCVAGIVGSAGWYVWGRPSVRAERLLREAHELQTARDFAQAEQHARRALELDDTLGEAALVAAECAATRQEFELAADYALRVPADDPVLRLRAALLAARLYEQRLHRFSLAEGAYRLALDVDPDNRTANEGLARLLGMCGRRWEAVPHILHIVRTGEPTDLLLMLARENVVVQQPDLLEAAREADPQDPNPLVGLAWHAAESNQIDHAVELLRKAISLSPAQAAAHVALGRQLLAERRFEELVNWSRQLPPDADGFPECWLVRAQLAERENDVPGAIRCYAEAARLAPENRQANLGLIRLLSSSGQAEDAKPFARHLQKLQELETVQNRVLFPGNPGGVESLLELARSYETAGRLWEAFGWSAVAVGEDPVHPGVSEFFENLRQHVDGLPLRITVDAANPALTLDLAAFPVPDFRNISPASPPAESGPLSAIAFRNDTEAAGLTFRYFNGTDGPPTRRMYEFTGGGIAVLDLDRDDREDVYFTQGCAWPPGSPDEAHHDRLFRNRNAQRFQDVTDRARITEHDFGQGATVGDFNADGFPDLYVANIGLNRLWLNNGDGSFSECDIVRSDSDSWTTSCAMADLDGDALPDIYDVNYLTGDDLFDRVCHESDGSPRLCMPFHFDGAPDLLRLNDGSGGFPDATESVLPIRPDGKGLGIAVWDVGGEGRLSILVANDTTPNFFFFPLDGSHRFEMSESGVACGIALNEHGKPEGCMGIAIGDFNEDGRFDAYVTNFLAESNTLYLNAGGRLFQDATRQTRLHLPTLEFLGFGTRFLDADLDGRLELFVTNGHIDQLPGKPYRMLPQWFRWDGQQAVPVEGSQVGPYFQQAWLGRAAARIDWNCDGREDLLVGHLGDDSALLTNTTPARGRFLSLRLTGVTSDRDAIGATVRARVGDRTLVRQLTAGDGYQASNERRIHLGVDAEKMDELTVDWPSGAVQRFENVATGQRLLLVEGGALQIAPLPRK